jgi:hypothetical protein
VVEYRRYGKLHRDEREGPVANASRYQRHRHKRASPRAIGVRKRQRGSTR